VFKAYCAKKAVSEDGVRFLFDGSRLTKQQTPEDLEMEDGDSIECMTSQVGGC
jgi:small ubiquitin-related modifier